MSIVLGIIGLAQSGKTTVFNTLTRGQAETTASQSPRVAAGNGFRDCPGSDKGDSLEELAEARDRADHRLGGDHSRPGVAGRHHRPGAPLLN